MVADLYRDYVSSNITKNREKSLVLSSLFNFMQN